MRKTICFLVIFVMSGLFLFADENKKNTIGLDMGAGYTYTSNPKLKGGHFELGLSLYRGNVYVQNRLLFRATGLEIDGLDSTILTLSDKLVFGRGSSGSGIYVYIEGGAGYYGNSEKEFFTDDALVYSFGFGGGLELGGIYFETGYLGQKITSNFPLSGIVFQTGWRVRF